MIQPSVPEKGATRAARLFSRSQPIVLWIGGALFAVGIIVSVIFWDYVSLALPLFSSIA